MRLLWNLNNVGCLSQHWKLLLHQAKVELVLSELARPLQLSFLIEAGELTGGSDFSDLWGSVDGAMFGSIVETRGVVSPDH